MPRYAALLRGVSPLNATMPELKAAFEEAGFTDVKTLLSTGNVVFTAKRAGESWIERKAEAAISKRLGRHFLTIVRPVDAIRRLLDADPYGAFGLPPGSKRVVSFLRDEPESRLALPIELDGARILRVEGREIFTAYLPSPKGAVFMRLIEKTFGKDVTTRTWETVAKLAR